MPASNKVTRKTDSSDTPAATAVPWRWAPAPRVCVRVHVHMSMNRHTHRQVYSQTYKFHFCVAGSSILGQDQKTRREKDAEDQPRPHSAAAFIPHGDASPGVRFHLCLCVDRGKSRFNRVEILPAISALYQVHLSMHAHVTGRPRTKRTRAPWKTNR